MFAILPVVALAWCELHNNAILSDRVVSPLCTDILVADGADPSDSAGAAPHGQELGALGRRLHHPHGVHFGYATPSSQREWEASGSVRTIKKFPLREILCHYPQN